MQSHYTAFDQWVAGMRYQVAEQNITPDSKVCDVGCGVDVLFLQRLQNIARIRIGIDWQKTSTKFTGIHLVQGNINSGLPFDNACFDYVTLLAVLEHLENPEIVFQEAHRILSPKGILIVTWPSQLIDPLLHLLMVLRIVSSTTEADKHQPRKPASHWVRLAQTVGFTNTTHQRFELGLNNLLVARRT